MSNTTSFGYPIPTVRKVSALRQRMIDDMTVRNFAPCNSNGPACADPDSIANPTFPYSPHRQFQFHHNAFNYYAAFAPGMPARSHLRDEQEFIDLANSSTETCKADASDSQCGIRDIAIGDAGQSGPVRIDLQSHLGTFREPVILYNVYPGERPMASLAAARTTT
jgi:hypothetical protein